jgi:hypothetical protein
MAIRVGRVAMAGIAAGLVMGVIDWIVGKFITGPMMIADMNNFKAGMGDAMNAPNAWMGQFFFDIIMGVLLVWLYAAIRPRFGAGMKTAVFAAIYIWLVASYFTLAYGFMGMMTWGHWIIQAGIWFVILLIAASVGGRIYTEDAATA